MSGYFEFKAELEVAKTRLMCNEMFDKSCANFLNIPEKYITKKMCTTLINDNWLYINIIPDKYKVQLYERAFEKMIKSEDYYKNLPFVRRQFPKEMFTEEFCESMVFRYGYIPMGLIPWEYFNKEHLLDMFKSENDNGKVHYIDIIRGIKDNETREKIISFDAVFDMIEYDPNPNSRFFPLSVLKDEKYILKLLDWNIYNLRGLEADVYTPNVAAMVKKCLTDPYAYRKGISLNDVPREAIDKYYTIDDIGEILKSNIYGILAVHDDEQLKRFMPMSLSSCSHEPELLKDLTSDDRFAPYLTREMIEETLISICKNYKMTVYQLNGFAYLNEKYGIDVLELFVENTDTPRWKINESSYLNSELIDTVDYHSKNIDRILIIFPFLLREVPVEYITCDLLVQMCELYGTRGRTYNEEALRAIKSVLNNGEVLSKIAMSGDEFFDHDAEKLATMVDLLNIRVIDSLSAHLIIQLCKYHLLSFNHITHLYNKHKGDPSSQYDNIESVTCYILGAAVLMRENEELLEKYSSNYGKSLILPEELQTREFYLKLLKINPYLYSYLHKNDETESIIALFEHVAESI